MPHLLIVDDEQSICWGLSKLASQLGLSAATAATAEEGLDLARARRPDTIVLDVRLPGIDGLSAMQLFREAVGEVPIVVMTAYGDLDTAVQAVRNGAFDYLTKPFDLSIARRAIERALSSGPPPVPRDEAKVKEFPGGIVGASSAMQEVFKRIALVAPSDACVHLQGESGTGKELVARAIHRFSRRSEGPFVAVNIASLSPSLAESELFGHVRGAFTGAEQPRKGLLEQADGGTIFLDEVAEIPMAVQVKLLRALEHGEVLPVGADRPLRLDFRVISATNRDLSQRVADRSFRHDLYFRLITFEITLPPLRQRCEDIPQLVDHFLNLLTARSELARPTVPPETHAELWGRPWYGNVRELRNAIEHATILARGGPLLVEHLPPPAASGTTAPAQEPLIGTLIRQWAESKLQQGTDEGDLYERFLGLTEPPLLRAVLDHCHGQYAAAARRLGLHRTTLRKKLGEPG